MAIDLKDIVTISGHSGLFKSIATTQQGLVVESLDECQKRSVKQMQRYNISTLEDIGIYTTGEEETIPLATILWRLYAEFGGLMAPELHDTAEKRQALMQRIVPDYDTNRVYESNIKKLFQWYNILTQYAPLLFKAVQDTAPEDAE